MQLGTHRYRFFGARPRACRARGAWSTWSTVPPLYARAASTPTDPDEHRRFLALTHAAFICCQHMGFAPQIMHFNDWHTAFGPLLLRATLCSWDRLFADTRSVLTMHNIGYQGDVRGSGAADLRSRRRPAPAAHQDDLRAGHINLLAPASCTRIRSRPSARPMRARSTRAEYGMGLQDAAARARRCAGRHPQRRGLRRMGSAPRPLPAAPLRRQPAGVKARSEAGVPARMSCIWPAARAPLVGIVSALATQKGFDLLLRRAAARCCTRATSCWSALGSGEARYEDFFAEPAAALSRARHLSSRLQR